jgi:hypothetical protein
MSTRDILRHSAHFADYRQNARHLNQKGKLLKTKEPQKRFIAIICLDRVPHTPANKPARKLGVTAEQP